MKGRVLRVIDAWQRHPTRPRGVCRFTPSCSSYAYTVIDEWGVVRGGLLGAWRVARCNGFVRGGVDEPPARRRHASPERLLR